MENIIQFFETIPASTRSIYLVSGFVFFLIVEMGIPHFRFEYNKLKHILLNLFFTLTTLVINFAGASLILLAADYNKANSTGILNIFMVPLWLKIILGILLLDFVGAWLVHWIEHKVKWLWKFHLIHHTDPYIDVSSGLRHHPGESVIRLLFTALAVLVTGAPFGVVMIYQTLSAFFAHLTHANIIVPTIIDKTFATIFVTPHFHKIHHHYIQPHTDSNYGNIFSIWDHLLRTTTSVKKIDEITYGIDTHMAPEENSNIKNLLMIPFQKYRAPVGSKFSD
ncbi:MAG: sterol desaturase family protein [Candidatus Marinimicrobia bacterium]|nr:sterol desaturase family protein [Candidatus Neomarinimicrobiota bacterium]MDP7329800.1 sterol desaturase family protein [Candidatus Neomarinimicrobiota bacterium]